MSGVDHRNVVYSHDRRRDAIKARSFDRTSHTRNRDVRFVAGGVQQHELARKCDFVQEKVVSLLSLIEKTKSEKDWLVIEVVKLKTVIEILTKFQDSIGIYGYI